MRLLILLLVAVLPHGSAAKAQGSASEKQYLGLIQERDQLSRSVKLLQDEVRLSRGKHLYLVVDFRSKQMLLKVDGLLLRRIPVADVRKLGNSGCSTGATVLEYFENARTPAVSAGGSPDAEKFVEVSDMPQSYELGFGSGDRSVTLSIRPVPSTRMARTWLSVSATLQSGSYALMRAVGFRRASYRLLLSPEDARALYWAVEKGCPAILACD